MKTDFLKNTINRINKDSNALGIGAIWNDIKHLFPEETLVFSNNNGSDQKLFKRSRNICHGEVKAQGLNDYRNLTNCVCLTALNPPGYYYDFMKAAFGIDRADIRRAKYRELVYQQIMRIDLRNTGSTRANTVFVPEEATALWLNDAIFGGNATICLVPTNLDRNIVNGIKATRGSKKSGKARTNAQRQAEYRRRQAEKKALAGKCSEWTSEIRRQLPKKAL